MYFKSLEVTPYTRSMQDGDDYRDRASLEHTSSPSPRASHSPGRGASSRMYDASKSSSGPLKARHDLAYAHASSSSPQREGIGQGLLPVKQWRGGGRELESKRRPPYPSYDTHDASRVVDLDVSRNRRPRRYDDEDELEDDDDDAYDVSYAMARHACTSRDRDRERNRDRDRDRRPRSAGESRPMTMTSSFHGHGVSKFLEASPSCKSAS
jgi:hypothetical protein